MTNTGLREVERFKVGFADDWTGATHKYLILDETINKYRVRHFMVMHDAQNMAYLASTPIEIKDKSEVTDIHYETLEGERI